MNVKTFTILVLALIVAVGLVVTLGGPLYALRAKSVDAGSDATPEEAVTSFYDWYTGYAGNPLADGAYRSSEYLSEEFVERVDGIIASFEKGGYDPFLCAQDKPARFTVEDGTRSDDADTSVVVVHEVWNPDTQHELVRDLHVRLRLDQGSWQIADIDCSGSPPTERSIIVTPQGIAAETPEQVVTHFYDWYLDYIGDPATGEMHSPLVDGAYRSSEHLTEELVKKVDGLLASFEGGGYDPFLCAQAVPRCIRVRDQVVSGDRASIVVTTSFADHQFTVDLVPVDGEWKITDVDCAKPEPVFPLPEGPIITTPEGTVNAFYSWYLWYTREIGNPLIDKAYQLSEYPSEGLIQKVDGIIDSFDKGGYDPFLCVQDVPESLSIEDAVVSGDVARVVVHTSFEGHGFTVALRRVGERWEMTDVLCEVEDAAPEEPPPAGSGSVEGWQVFQDAEYGFEIQYPAEWTFHEVELRYPEVDAPIVRMVHFLPQEWADQMNIGGPPDSNNVIVAPLSLEVSGGTLEAYRRKYAEPVLSETIDVNGQLVTREQDVLGDGHMARYLFQHPKDTNLRVTLVDQISGLSSRIEGNEDLANTIQQMLTTFQFAH